MGGETITENSALYVANRSSGKMYALLVTVVIIVAALVFCAGKFNHEDEITEINISGNEILSNDEILNLIAVSDTSREITHSLIDIRAQLKKHPYILSADLFKKKSGAVHLEIHEKKPIAALIDNHSEIKFTAKDRSILPYRLYKGLPDLPLLRNLWNYEKINREALEKAIDILEYLQKEKPLIYGLISEIIYDNQKRDFNIITSDDGKLIRLGHYEDMEIKFLKLDKIIRKIAVGSRSNNIKYIDLRWNNQIIISEKKT